MMLWKNYTNLIKRNCASSESAVHDLLYWRNNLFARTLIYLLPFCLIALIPGLYWMLSTEQYLMAFVDLITIISLAGVAFIPTIFIHTRKIMFIACAYIFSCLLLYNVGLSGPGLIFLLTASILCTLIFPAVYAWGAAVANTVICLIFIIALSFQLLPLPKNPENRTGEWVAVTSNLVFLSFLSAALIPRLFTGLQQTIDKEKALQLQLGEEQKLLEQAMALLQQKNNEIEQFAYAASHDLQEPLRMISSFLTLLEKKYDSVLDDKGKQYIHFAVDGAKRMRQFILDLLEFSRAGQTPGQLEVVDLNELIREVEMICHKQIDEKNASIQSQKLPVVSGYKSPLKQVFQNLISNALKYGSETAPTQIAIAVKETNTHWQFSITDNGIGIADEYGDKIFILFQRLHSNDKYPGSGMGLAICKKIIEGMNGKIWVKSKEGEGSVFYFTIHKTNIALL